MHSNDRQINLHVEQELLRHHHPWQAVIYEKAKESERENEPAST